jgi:hypothetical protein
VESKSSKPKRRNNNESTNSAQTNTRSTTSDRNGADRTRHFHGRASPRNDGMRYHKHQPFIPCDSVIFPGWIAQIDVQ